jgi:hypothetical protein
MGDLDDFDLGKAPPDDEAAPLRVEDEGGKRQLWIGVTTGVTLVVAAAAYLWLGRSPAVPILAPASSRPLVSTTPAPPAATAPADLPTLDASDGLVRELARSLSSDPLFASWLGAEGLARRLAASAAAIVEGGPLHQLLSFLGPQGAFSVIERGGRTFVDAQSFARYDAVVAAAASIDTAAAVVVLRRLEPLLDGACRELGQESGFAELIERAAHLLLAAPAPAGDFEVRRVVRDRVVYVFARPDLEALQPAQKHLLRLGPRNAERIRAKLRELLRALGQPPPAP